MNARFEIKSLRPDGTYLVGVRTTKEQAIELIRAAMLTGRCPFNGGDVVTVELFDRFENTKQRFSTTVWHAPT